MERKEEFNTLFNAHYAKVFRLCKGYFNGDEAFASDTAQEIFIKIWERLDSFRNESSISTWIYKISVNTCLMQLRKQTVKKKVNAAMLSEVITASHSADDDDKLRRMYDCIQKLDEKGKMIILMVLEGISYEEIAVVIGITEDNLRVNIHRIKKKLTNCVQQ